MEYELMDKKPQIYNEIKSDFNSITDDRIHQVIVNNVKKCFKKCYRFLYKRIMQIVDFFCLNMLKDL